MNDQNNEDFNNLDNLELENKATPKSFIITFILILLVILSGGILFYLLFLRKNESKNDCQTGEENKCLSCDKNQCLSCNIGYKLLDGKCILNYSFRAEYYTEKENQIITLINKNYLNNVIELIIDGNKVNDIFAECKFNSTGIHKVYFLFNLNGMTSVDNMFKDIQNMTSIHFSYLFNTENITSMNYMFAELKNLTFANLSFFNGENLFMMKGMFQHCSSLKSVDFSNFNAPKLDNVEYLFQECSDLEYVNFNNFNAPNLKCMRQMFYKCQSLKSIDLSSLNSEDVTYLDEICYDCWSLKYLNMKNINYKSIIHYQNKIFSNCSHLSYIDISSFTGEDSTIILFDENLPSKGDIILRKDFYNTIKNQIPQGWKSTFV